MGIGSQERQIGDAVRTRPGREHVSEGERRKYREPAGASSYGIADLALLAADTHKFEARYCDRLIGPWPGAKDVYEARSPIHHLDGFDRPLIVFQGLDDMVVPPNQSEMIVAALRAKGVECEYHAYEGEGHGFRQAATIVASLTAELAFYQRILP